MIKKILIALGIVLVTNVAIITYFMYKLQSTEHPILEFIKSNPERTAIKLVYNDNIVAEQNPNRIMPLASTVKIIIAIEYAQQSALGRVDPNELIPLKELSKYYVPNTDGGAHPRWLRAIENEVSEDQIAIREIAKGMIQFSSNANTEWMSQKLGLENINARIDSLGIKDHSEIYYFVSALFVGKEKFPESKGEELADSLRSLEIDEYINITDTIHSKLSTDTLYKSDIGDSGLNIQRIWSDNLTRSTVSEYVGLMKMLNSKNHFDIKTHEYLDEVMEGLMKSPGNQKLFWHAGQKGGSTPFVLTKAIYATDKNNNTIELAYLFNDLGKYESKKLRRHLNQFDFKTVTKEDFRETIKTTLKQN